MTRLSQGTCRPSTARGRPARPWSPWWRESVELAVLFVAVGAAELFAQTVGRRAHGPVALIALGAAVIAGAFAHRWWVHRHGRAHAWRHGEVPGGHLPPGDEPAATASIDGPAEESTFRPPVILWRIRTTLRDTPGRLAAVCACLGDRGVNILSVQVHQVPGAVVDEFLVAAPSVLAVDALATAITLGGGRQTWIQPANPHDLVDVPTRVLALAVRAATDSAELPFALRALLGGCEIRWVPMEPGRADARDTGAAGATPVTRPVATRAESVGTHSLGADLGDDSVGMVTAAHPDTVSTIRLRDPGGGALVVSRPELPFTPAEVARAHALAGLPTRLAPCAAAPDGRVWATGPTGFEDTAATGAEVSLRRPDRHDGAAVAEMHQRCSAATLRRRYRDADPRPLVDHLIRARFGYSLVAETRTGDVVGIGTLIWDGAAGELAVLVEDGWQRQGIGTALARRLVALAGRAGIDAVYAVVDTAVDGLDAARRLMHRAGVSVDDMEEGATAVVTGRLAAPMASRPDTRGTAWRPSTPRAPCGCGARSGP